MLDPDIAVSPPISGCLRWGKDRGKSAGYPDPINGSGFRTCVLVTGPLTFTISHRLPESTIKGD